MARNYRLDQFDQLRGKDIFVDANVLIYLFWATGQYDFEENYATVFRNLLRQRNTLKINFLVISEIVNRAIKAEYGKYLLSRSLNNTELKYKDFRNSHEGKSALRDIYLIVKNQILTQFSVIDMSFNSQDIEGFLIVDELDFVDKATVEICSRYDLVLLTNDQDFKNCGLDILTGNPKILR